jgi:hypothetical protein
MGNHVSTHFASFLYQFFTKKSYVAYLNSTFKFRSIINSVILDFRRCVNEVFAVLGCYTEPSGP